MDAWRKQIHMDNFLIKLTNGNIFNFIAVFSEKCVYCTICIVYLIYICAKRVAPIVKTGQCR